MKLVIVESPAKAKTINKYLGSGYNVLASFGHIRDLPSKNGSVRPDEDFAMDYEISAQSQKHVKEIADAVKKSDILYLATDPDREGEAISWHVVEALKERKALKKNTDVKRIVFNEITKKAVTAAIENPRDIDMDLVNAQQARRALDYLVGFTLSPVLWRKLPGSKSAGRVQSVALRLISEREEEIEQFTSQEYWDITVHLKTGKNDDVSAMLTHINGEKLDKFALTNEKAAQEVVSQLQHKNYAVKDIEKKQTKRNPYAPFTTSSLQQEASRKLGFGASKTMMVAQKLYEGIDLSGETVGLITYMRTDGVTVSEDAITATRSLIKERFGDNYVPANKRIYKTKAKNAQEAHEAIRPTDVTRTPESVAKFLDKDQIRLYELIWKRMIASQMESVVLDQVAAIIVTHDTYASCRATGSTIKFDGFYALYNEDRDDPDPNQKEENTSMLPNLEKGEALKLETVDPEQHFTQPPPRYSEASLVKKMEELGIGRPSTYASIISVLQSRNYVKLEKKRFIPESRGRIVTAFLTSYFHRYVEYDFTAQLEHQLDEISAGDKEWKAVLTQFWKDFIHTIDEVKEHDSQSILQTLEKLLEHILFVPDKDGKIERNCPDCHDGELHLKLGKFGAFIGCSSYPDCRFTKQIGLDADGDEETGHAGGSAEPRMLGVDEETGKDITIRKGPYGFYIQIGEAEKGTKAKPKRSTVPKGMDPESVTLDIALGLLSLPREIGKHPETGKVIKAGIGRFGPYILHDGKYVSLKGEDDVLTVGMNRAVTLIAEKARKSGSEPLRVLGKHPKDDTDIAIYDGRYGPYVKYNKINATIPKAESVDELTLDRALELIAAKEAKGGKTSKGKVKKKAAPKKKKS